VNGTSVVETISHLKEVLDEFFDISDTSLSPNMLPTHDWRARNWRIKVTVNLAIALSFHYVCYSQHTQIVAISLAKVNSSVGRLELLSMAKIMASERVT
jgi:hypothetical protein